MIIRLFLTFFICIGFALADGLYADVALFYWGDKLYQPSGQSYASDNQMQDMVELTPLQFVKLCCTQLHCSYHEIIDATIDSLVCPERQRDILYVTCMKIIGKNMLLVLKTSGSYLFSVIRSEQLTVRQKIKKSWWLVIGGCLFAYACKLYILDKIPAGLSNQLPLSAGFAQRPLLSVSLK